MAQEEKRISARELISAERVMEIWSVSDSELIEEIQRGNFTVLFCSKKPRKAPDGKVLFSCWEGTDANIYHGYATNGGDDWYDFSNVYFYAIDISEHQINFPHLTMPIADTLGITQNNDDIIGTNREWVNFDEARKMLCMTPKELLQLLDAGKIETTIEEERSFSYNDYMNSSYTDGDFIFFTKDKIEKFMVNIVSIKRYVESNSTTVPSTMGKGPVANIRTNETDLTKQNDFLSADDLCQRWAISPAQLVGVVKSNDDLPVYWGESHVPF